MSDAGGWFPQLFAADGTVVDITLKTSGGSTVKTYEDFTFVGADSGGFARTMPDGTRLTLTGSGGRVLIQAGDASPDNIGGKLTIEGYAGTQLDEMLLDSALVDTTGRYTENSKKLIGVVASPATTLSAATSVVIPLANDPSGVRRWTVEFFDMTTSAATVIVISVQLSFDGGTTYKSTNEYDSWIWGRDQAGPGVAELVQSAAAAGQIAQVNSNTNKLVWGSLEILSPLSSSSSNATLIRGDVSGMNKEATNRAVRYLSTVICQGSSFGRPTHVKLIANTGNIDCKYVVTPMRGFGET